MYAYYVRIGLLLCNACWTSHTEIWKSMFYFIAGIKEKKKTLRQNPIDASPIKELPKNKVKLSRSDTTNITFPEHTHTHTHHRIKLTWVSNSYGSNSIHHCQPFWRACQSSSMNYYHEFCNMKSNRKLFQVINKSTWTQGYRCQSPTTSWHFNPIYINLHQVNDEHRIVVWCLNHVKRQRVWYRVCITDPWTTFVILEITWFELFSHETLKWEHY